MVKACWFDFIYAAKFKLVAFFITKPILDLLKETCAIIRIIYRVFYLTSIKVKVDLYVTWGQKLQRLEALAIYTANIFEVIFTVFNCVLISTVISLYGLHLIAAPSTTE